MRARWRLLLKGPFALPALFFGSVLESTVLPWPIEFPMLAFMLRGRPQTIAVTLVVSLGSVTGCFLAFLAGALALEALDGFISARPGLAASLEAARIRVEALGAPAVFFAMLAPVPVQLASFAAGAAGLGAPAFLLAAFVGRTLRYAAMGVLVYAFGPAVLDWWARLPAALRRGVRVVLVVMFAGLLISALSAVLSWD